MAEVVRAGTSTRIRRTGSGFLVEVSRGGRGCESCMHQRGLPNGFTDGRNRAMLGVPLLVRIAGPLRVARQQAGADTRRRTDVIRERLRASVAGP
jgi:hypothetical protein